MVPRFAWSSAKDAANVRKHGVGFEEAAWVFRDPFASSEQDRIEGWERRWQTVGAGLAGVIMFVAHTVEDLDDGDELIRIISARKADRRERER